MPTRAEPAADGLHERLEEAEQTLEAIRSGHVDAVVVQSGRGPRIYTLESPDQPFRTFVEAMQEGALTVAEDGTILYANSFFASLVGRELTDVVGSKLPDLVVPECRFTCEALLEVGFRATATAKGSCTLETPDGHVPVQLTLSALHGAEDPTCCVVVFDLRERARVEHAMAAREAAEQASAAKDDFLAVLSHELRSPLNTILGWARILTARTDLNATARRGLAAIERNARTQAQLIADLLDISRIVSQKLNLEFEMVDFAGLVEAAIGAAEMSFVEKKVRVVHSITEGDAYVYGDPVRLQQIVTNLLNNALKFTGDGGQVEVLLAREGSRMVLTVQDNGMGIERDELGRVFDRFRQGRESARRVKGGLGLGLAIAKELVEAHRGTIRANSDGAGRGARFTVELPAAEAPLVSARPATALGPQLGPVRVLVVDDEPDIVELTRHVLEISGARVHTATGAKDALLLLEEHEFDLFLSDIGLPEHDGLALIREVRARGFTPERLPAIAITGYATRADDDLALAAGFQLHLAKPLDPRSLLQAIATMVPRPEARVS